jgi:hypothetical protein
LVKKKLSPSSFQHFYYSFAISFRTQSTYQTWHCRNWSLNIKSLSAASISLSKKTTILLYSTLVPQLFIALIRTTQSSTLKMLDTEYVILLAVLTIAVLAILEYIWLCISYPCYSIAVHLLLYFMYCVYQGFAYLARRRDFRRVSDAYVLQRQNHSAGMFLQQVGRKV